MNREKKRGLIYQIINPKKKKKAFYQQVNEFNTHGVKLKTVK